MNAARNDSSTFAVDGCQSRSAWAAFCSSGVKDGSRMNWSSGSSTSSGWGSPGRFRVLSLIDSSSRVHRTTPMSIRAAHAWRQNPRFRISASTAFHQKRNGHVSASHIPELGAPQQSRRHPKIRSLRETRQPTPPPHQSPNSPSCS